MSADDNKATAQTLNEAFNTNDAAVAIALCTPEVEIINVATGAVYRGPEGIRPAHLPSGTLSAQYTGYPAG